ncbi:PAS domain-containing protein [Cellulomonas sp. Y8]|uniref:PAS domain-containing protein n=1 Tax=Cellulomonas sp. Y8 TaxID=2591145 RepID=UPI003D75E508
MSKTDTKGVIQYANDVFLRVSAYSEHQVIGQPHSLIRHPAMPRGIFHLLWATISSGKEIFAYINNLAADGAHYWVLAHVTPSYNLDGKLVGYHSNRRSPERSAIAVLTPLYEKMLHEETQHRNAREAAAASSAMLGDMLTQDGTTYEKLVWELTNRSMADAR